MLYLVGCHSVLTSSMVSTDFYITTLPPKVNQWVSSDTLSMLVQSGTLPLRSAFHTCAKNARKVVLSAVDDVSIRKYVIRLTLGRPTFETALRQSSAPLSSISVAHTDFCALVSLIDIVGPVLAPKELLLAPPCSSSPTY